MAGGHGEDSVTHRDGAPGHDRRSTVRGWPSGSRCHICHVECLRCAKLSMIVTVVVDPRRSRFAIGTWRRRSATRRSLNLGPVARDLTRRHSPGLATLAQQTVGRTASSPRVPSKRARSRMETSFQLQVANGSGRQARQLVERALKSWRLWHQGEGPLVTNTMIVVTELVENVERHTAAGGKLNLHLRPGALLIEVTDTSTASAGVVREGPPPRRRPRPAPDRCHRHPMGYSLDTRRQGGLGGSQRPLAASPGIRACRHPCGLTHIPSGITKESRWRCRCMWCRRWWRLP